MKKGQRKKKKKPLLCLVASIFNQESTNLHSLLRSSVKKAVFNFALDHLNQVDLWTFSSMISVIIAVPFPGWKMRVNAMTWAVCMCSEQDNFSMGNLQLFTFSSTYWTCFSFASLIFHHSSQQDFPSELIQATSCSSPQHLCQMPYNCHWHSENAIECYNWGTK